VFPFDKFEQSIASPIQPPVVTFQPLTSVSAPYLAKSSAPTKPPAPTSTSLAPLFLPAYHGHIHSTGTGPDLSLSHVSTMAPVSPDVALFFAGSPTSGAVCASLVLSDLPNSPVPSPAGSPSRFASPAQPSPLMRPSTPGSSPISPLDLIYVLICLISLFSKAKTVCLPLNHRLHALTPWCFAHVHLKLPT
jgi:hypothetical protein